MAVQPANNRLYQSVIKEKQGVALFRFWANWCAPCRMMTKVYARVEQRLSAQAAFYDVNIDRHSELTERCRIRSIPTIIIVKNGKEVKRIDGVSTPDDLQRLVEKYLH